MVSDEALKKLQEQIAAWPVERRFAVQQLIRDYLRNREDLRDYEATRLTPRGVEILKEEKLSSDGMILIGRLMSKKLHEIGCERLHELADADKDDRLVVLPCKVGDGLWTFCSHPVEQVYSFTVTHISTLNGRTMLNTSRCGVIDARDVGKTVFLTREEAEKALEGMTC